MIRRILCALGFHRWGPYNDDDSIWAQRRCEDCRRLSETSSYR